MAYPTRTYYALARPTGKKFSDTYIIQTIASNRIEAEAHLRSRGHRILYAFSKRALSKVQSMPREEFFQTRPQWPAETYDLIQKLKEDHQ